MNERIKELANKAVGKRSCYMIEAEYIKFAELIVRECAQVASNQVMDVEGNDWGVRHAIETHFGVDE
jgi:hypothetical protein